MLPLFGQEKEKERRSHCIHFWRENFKKIPNQILITRETQAKNKKFLKFQNHLLFSFIALYKPRLRSLFFCKPETCSTKLLRGREGLTMYVVKRDGRQEAVHFDKITARLKKLSYGLSIDHCDPVLVAQKVCTGVYKGVTTSQLDELAAETAAAMTANHPDYASVSLFLFSFKKIMIF